MPLLGVWVCIVCHLGENQFIQAQIKENMKVPRNLPLCGEVTADCYGVKFHQPLNYLFKILFR